MHLAHQRFQKLDKNVQVGTSLRAFSRRKDPHREPQMIAEEKNLAVLQVERCSIFQQGRSYTRGLLAVRDAHKLAVCITFKKLAVCIH